MSSDRGLRIGVGPATAIVVASMIGTGVFTTTGLLVRDVGSPSAVLLLWVVGGLAALAGAMSYAELSAAFPRNGAEYALLGRAFHPAVGFVAGVAGVLAGFAGPTAASAVAFGRYLAAAIPGVPPTPAALVLIVALALVQGIDADLARRWQSAVTLVEVALVAAFAAVGLYLGGWPADPAAAPPLLVAAKSAPFAVGLVYVSYAYSGWNGAAYVAGELHEPGRTAPRALLAGTALVTALYVALNAAFLSSAPVSELAGVVEVGDVAARAWFGAIGASAVSSLIALCLCAMVGAMLLAGPRLIAVMGEDLPLFGALAARNEGGIPARAVALQAALAIALVLGVPFDRLLGWMGTVLGLAAAATVLAVPWLRIREPALHRPYRVPLYPLPPLAFAAVTLWSTWFVVAADPAIGWASAAVVALGLVLWGALRFAPSPRS